MYYGQQLLNTLPAHESNASTTTMVPLYKREKQMQRGEIFRKRQSQDLNLGYWAAVALSSSKLRHKCQPKIYSNSICIPMFGLVWFFLPVPMAYGSSQARERTCTTAATWAAAVISRARCATELLFCFLMEQMRISFHNLECANNENLIFLFLFFSFCLFRATSASYGGSQARGGIRAAASSLCHSHSNAGSKLHLRSIPQLMATPDA